MQREASGHPSVRMPTGRAFKPPSAVVSLEQFKHQVSQAVIEGHRPEEIASRTAGWESSRRLCQHRRGTRQPRWMAASGWRGSRLYSPCGRRPRLRCGRARRAAPSLEHCSQGGVRSVGHGRAEGAGHCEGNFAGAAVLRHRGRGREGGGEGGPAAAQKPGAGGLPAWLLAGWPAAWLPPSLTAQSWGSSVSSRFVGSCLLRRRREREAGAGGRAGPARRGAGEGPRAGREQREMQALGHREGARGEGQTAGRGRRVCAPPKQRRAHGRRASQPRPLRSPRQLQRAGKTGRRGTHRSMRS